LLIELNINYPVRLPPDTPSKFEEGFGKKEATRYGQPLEVYVAGALHATPLRVN